MKKTRSALRRRTDAERAAIDARADAWERPLTATQCEALSVLQHSGMHRVRAGFEPLFRKAGVFPVATIRVLVRRGLAIFESSDTAAYITAKGRKAARSMGVQR
jgi:hypothetical protein